MTAELRPDSFSAVFSRALRGHPCSVVGIFDLPQPLPMDSWTREADESDHLLLDECVGATVDIGCGPGRLSARLVELGHTVLGIDVVHEAVRRTRDRGASAIVRDVYDTLPGEGRWETALLADGNIGISGDPVGLLRRVSELLHPRGRVVVEVGSPGTGLHTVWATLECDQTRSRPFRWSMVGADVIHEIADKAGMTVSDLRERSGRWCAVLAGP
jgi:SAM-dependent methyltransferase